jgi:hypothetical protein
VPGEDTSSPGMLAILARPGLVTRLMGQWPAGQDGAPAGRLVALGPFWLAGAAAEDERS